MTLEKDKTYSHYTIISEIGSGGMGEVYLAEDTKLDRKVAIKFLNEKYSDDKEKLKRFVQVGSPFFQSYANSKLLT